jgi:predicted AlkP superfamily phosphohydrolase/phosphomutase
MWMHLAKPDDRAEPEKALRYRDLLDRAYEIVDSFIAGLCCLAGEDTIVAVVSDHGFLPGSIPLPLVDLFVEAGLLVWKDEPASLNRQTVAETPTADTHRTEKRFWAERVDWAQSLAAPLSGNEVYINLKGREPDGIVEPGKEYEDVRTRVIDLLLDYRDPRTGKRVVNMALRKEECRSLGLWGDRVGDIIFTQIPETGSHGKQLPVADFGGGSMQGFLCLAGPGIRKGYRLERTSWIVDVAPTLCSLMGIPFPRDCEGAILHQLLECNTGF